LLGRTATSAADAAALGAVAGFNEGNGSNRFNKAGESALTGALVVGALPLGFAAAKGVVSPFLSNIIAQINPEGLARRQVARALSRVGRHQMKLQEHFSKLKSKVKATSQSPTPWVMPASACFRLWPVLREKGEHLLSTSLKTDRRDKDDVLATLLPKGSMPERPQRRPKAG
jgi:hypothetical protein